MKVIGSRTSQTVVEPFAELVHGGFAPVIPLLREFDYHKTGTVLPGLPYSVYSLLVHMDFRQKIFLKFLRHPQRPVDLWPEPWWPDRKSPENNAEWIHRINTFDDDLVEIEGILRDRQPIVTEVYPCGHSILSAITSNLQHNAYHLGQIKAIGRQLGVW
jgi:hypothetical protein